MNDITQHDHLLHTIQATHPDREIRVQPLPPEALADLPEGINPDDLAELVIPSTGPGHYAISLPGRNDPDPEFRLFFVNVNDMPGDGELLGVFTTETDAAAAAIAHEKPSSALSDTDLAEARQAAELASRGFPPRQRAAGSTATPVTRDQHDSSSQTDLGRG